MNQQSVPSESSRSGQQTLTSSKPSKESGRSKQSRISTLRSRKGAPLKESHPTEEDEKVFVSEILQSIVDTAFNQVHDRYLEKQTVHFVSHCSRLAWKALIEWEYLRKDRGGFGEFTCEVLDFEPEPSAKDSWADNSIPIAEINDKDATAVKESYRKSFLDAVSTLEEHKRSQLTEQGLSFEQKRSLSIHAARSCMVNRSKTVPKKRSDNGNYSATKFRGVTPARSFEVLKDTYELATAGMLESKNFPPSTVAVQYEITQGSRGVVSMREPSVKTIHLRKAKFSSTHHKRAATLSDNR